MVRVEDGMFVEVLAMGMGGWGERGGTLSMAMDIGGWGDGYVTFSMAL